MSSLHTIARWGAPVKWAELLLVPALVVLTSCNRQQPQSYNVPKETAPPPAPAGAPSASPHGDMSPGLALPQLDWSIPEGWHDAGPSEMSPANFAITNDLGEASVSVIPLPGQTVGELDVINIFRERFRMPRLDQAGLSELAQTTPIGPDEGNLYDMLSEADANHPAGRVLVAVLKQRAFNFYIRLTGEASVIDAEKEAFLQFLKSLSITAPASSGTPLPMTAAPSAPTGGSGGGLPDWTVPESWTPQPPPRMVLARFVAGPAGHAADITISAFPGDVGGAAANVNRWRGQIGLATVPDEEALGLLTTIEMADGEGQLVDLTGTSGDEPMRMIGAIVPRGGRTWFYKLVGHAHTAEEQKATFLEFLRSAKHPQ